MQERRNPLFIKSEFSHGLQELVKVLRVVNDVGASQSFIHQVRILSTNTSLSPAIWLAREGRNPLFIKSEFSRPENIMPISPLNPPPSQSFIHQVRILSWVNQKCSGGWSGSSRNPLFIKSEFSLAHLDEDKILDGIGYGSQSFIHQVRILSCESLPETRIRWVPVVAILYSSSQNSLRLLKCPEDGHIFVGRNPLFIKSEFSREDKDSQSLMECNMRSQSFIHQVRILSVKLKS